MNDNADGGNEGVLQLMHINEFHGTHQCERFGFRLVENLLFLCRDFNNGQFVNSGANSHINDVSTYLDINSNLFQLGVTFHNKVCCKIFIS